MSADAEVWSPQAAIAGTTVLVTASLRFLVVPLRDGSYNVSVRSIATRTSSMRSPMVRSARP